VGKQIIKFISLMEGKLKFKQCLESFSENYLNSRHETFTFSIQPKYGLNFKYVTSQSKGRHLGVHCSFLVNKIISEHLLL
jgi:hypothetical protein